MSNLNWNDLVFAGRNTNYGAYELRHAYTSRIVLAFVVSVASLFAIIAVPRLRAFLVGTPIVSMKPLEKIKYTNLELPPPIELPDPPKAQVQPVKEIPKYLPPEVTDKPVESNEVPKVDDVKSQTLVDGPTGDVVVDVPAVAPVATAPVLEPPITYLNPQEAAEFPGGVQALMKFVGKNLKYPAIDRRMENQGTVYVSFVIAPDGSIIETEAIKGVSTTLDAEAIRVIRAMPKWKPGKQNGVPVRVRFVLPIKFQLN